MPARFRMLVLALVSAGVVTAGCGKPQPAASIAVAANMILHTPEYESDGRALALAREELVRSCMSKQGFTYRTAALQPPWPPVAMPPPGSDYGLLTRVAAVDPRTMEWLRTPSAAPQAIYVKQLSPRRRVAYDLALDGSPQAVASIQVPDGPTITYQTDGCYARSIARLYGSLRAYHLLIAEQNVITLRFAQGMSHDQRFTRAGEQWSDCMSGHGFTYLSPSAARDAVYQAYVRSSDPVSVRPQELATAAADRECAVTSQIYSEQARAEQAALRSLPHSVMQSLAKLARQRSIAARHARHLVEGSGCGGMALSTCATDKSNALLGAGEHSSTTAP